MSLHTLYLGQTGIAQQLRASGEAIEITPKGGQAVPLTALVFPEESRIAGDQQGRKTIRSRRFQILKDEANAEVGGLADPQENSVVSLAGVHYALTTRQDCTTHWELNCDFIGRQERSRPGLRQ